jgi:hypothetical protein
MSSLHVERCTTGTASSLATVMTDQYAPESHVWNGLVLTLKDDFLTEPTGPTKTGVSSLLTLLHRRTGGPRSLTSLVRRP